MIDILAPILSALILGTARAADGANKIPRWVYVLICFVVVSWHTIFVEPRIWSEDADTAAWMWVLCVLTMLPPHALFSAIHGVPPQREDGEWQWLQEVSEWLLVRINPRFWLIPFRNSWYAFGIIYGAVRTLLIIPAAVWLNEPWLMLAMLQGAVFWVCGRISKKYDVAMAWGISAGFVGLMLC